ncbi:MAG: hypothetical protein H6901_02810 [Rhodobacteraceae bacterium]|nr:hypothetical protein [Paracoccaceae bacterium]
MSWRDLKLTHALLLEKGFPIMGVWSPSQNMIPKVVFVRWQRPCEQHEKDAAERFIFAPDIRHLMPSDRPKGCPWA